MGLHIGMWDVELRETFTLSTITPMLAMMIVVVCE